MTAAIGGLYWRGIKKNDNLLSCVKRLRRALAENGIPFGRKKFSPHITLIRKAEFDRRMISSNIPKQWGKAKRGPQSIRL